MKKRKSNTDCRFCHSCFYKKVKKNAADGIYSCTFCANTATLTKGTATCPVCKKNEWVKAINTQRIA